MSGRKFRSSDYFLFRLWTLIRGNAGADVRQLVITVLNYGAKHVIAVNSHRFKEDSRNFFETILDSLRRLHRLATRKLYRSLNRAVSQRLNRFVNCHRLLAFED